MTIEADFIQLKQDSALIDLVELNATGIGGTTYRGCNDAPKGTALVFGGVSYSGMPIRIEGIESSLTQAAGRATLTVSNILKTLQGTVIALKGFAGAEVTIKRTYAKYLDGGATPDPNQYILYNFIVRRVSSMQASTIVFELGSYLDQLNTMLPKEQMTRDRFPGLGRQRGLY